MREIKINKLHLENFKCHRLLDLNFSGRNVTICGDNATGKTSVYDALTWLLFGKDSRGAGEKAVEIKPLNAAGEVADHQAITMVEAELTVDGVAQALRRTYKEKWSTRRGSSEAVYDGNVSEYAIDGVPMKKNAFDAAVAEIVPEDVFRLLTSVSYFPETMRWQDRRNVLFDMTGTMTDAQIMAREPRFAALLDGMGALTLDKYKAKLSAERKGLTGTRDDAPIRISELQRTIDAATGTDYDAKRRERGLLENQLEAIKAELMAANHNSAVDDLRLQVRTIDQDIRDLKARNEEHRRQQIAQAGTFELEQDLRRARETEQAADWELSRVRNQAATYKAENAGIDHRIQEREQAIETALERLRGLWLSADAGTFVGGNCPTCGQPLPAAQLVAAQQKFETEKRNRLAEIENQAAALNQEKAGLRANAHYFEIPTNERLQALQDALAQAQASVKAVQDRLTAAKQQETAATDIPGYAEQIATMEARREALNAQATDMAMGGVQHIDNLTAQRDELNRKIDAVNQILAREALAADAGKILK